MQINLTTNAGSVAAGLKAKADALRNVRPALDPVAEEINRLTRLAFDTSTSVDGEVFAPLAPSTIKARARKLAANRAARGGGRPQRPSASARAIKPLDDTGELRRSAVATVVGTTVIFKMADHGKPHAAGGKGGRPLKRNPTVFRREGGQWVLQPALALALRERLAGHVMGRRS